MATPLQSLCLRARGRHSSIVSRRAYLAASYTRQTRTFHISPRHNSKKDDEDESDTRNLSPHDLMRKRKPVPLKPSQIDAPRASSTRQLLETFSVEEDEIDKIINEDEGNEYQTFLRQYGAALSPERPLDYDRFLEQNGFRESHRPPLDPSDEGQIANRIRDQERKISATSRYFADQNPSLEIVEQERPGFVAQGDNKWDPNQFGDETFNADDITALGHGYLEQHREIREYYRLAAWELPLLTQYAKPFEAPDQKTPLRFRYTHYMGEEHASEKKVVVEFCTADLPLEPKQRLKLVKLLGPRYNPQKDLAKISCESFPDPLQNKRYLSDLIDTLITEARQESTAEFGKDSFDDVPVDFRHVKWKKPPKFPDSWKMTPERREKLFQGWTAEIGRSQRALLEDTVVSGAKTITHYLGEKAAVEAPQPVKVR